ncbi:MAG: 1,4-alpha-glucan branching protein GlgB, partial [Halieaceae bacterium]|nr:1,4-alpha-glucan branching protein GlgB [Halieaceae bacterium]
QWIETRDSGDLLRRPVSIYEIHAGSWRRKPEQDHRNLSYLELAQELIPYVLDMGFTHIELMPISEFPFDGSWGYQPIGMFAPSIRFVTPNELKHFINECHRRNIGVLLDWVPGHFPSDSHGLGRFDGSCLYEHEDVRQGFHPEWNTLVFNYGRAEVVSYLLSNANFWIEEFHIDGLRVDAVASMLYLDYSREEGQWVPNRHGGRENLEAVELLRQVNASVYRRHPGIMMIAEESTDWPGVSNPVNMGGLGFGFKWNMGWMNDTLQYMQRDPIHRKYHHHEMTFGILYAWSEKYLLPLSHDEVVHGKASLLEKMPGDDWQKFANLRAYYGFMWAQPGKKLLFMGGEFGQRSEWNHDASLDWHLLEHASHRGLLQLVRDLNFLYRRTPALFELDISPEGFQWVQADNSQLSVYAWLRRGADDVLLAVSNMTPECHPNYRLGLPEPGRYREALNTDAAEYGGSGQGNGGGVWSQDIPWDGQPCSVVVTLPPLATVLFLHDES